MGKESLIASSSSLQLSCCFQSFLFIGFILFGLCTCCRIDFLQFGYGKGSFLGIVSLIVFIKIRQIRLTFLQFHDDQAHLQAPVTKVNITDHLMSGKTSHSLYTLSDDSCTQVAYMKRLCYIRSAIINDDRSGILCLFTAQAFSLCHLVHIRSQVAFLHLQIQKSRLYCLCRG